MKARRADRRSTPEPVPGEGPIRTCVGCRRRDRDSRLLRVVLDPRAQVVVPDPQRCGPGRGAWVHPEPGCMQVARDRKAFHRALRADRAASLDAALDM